MAYGSSSDASIRQEGDHGDNLLMQVLVKHLQCRRVAHSSYEQRFQSWKILFR